MIVRISKIQNVKLMQSANDKPKQNDGGAILGFKRLKRQNRTKNHVFRVPFRGLHHHAIIDEKNDKKCQKRQNLVKMYASPSTFLSQVEIFEPVSKYFATIL